MKKAILLLILFLSSYLNAQELNVSSNRNPAILGEQIILDFSINAKANNFQSPKFEGFRVVSGPNSSSSSSYSFANGKSESKVTSKYSFVLQTTRVGEFIIPSATIKVKGVTIKSKPLKIRIVKGNTKQQKQNKSIAENLFIKVKVNKKNIFVGEQIIVSYKLYTRVDLENTEISSIPNLNGFWKKDLEASSRFKREIIDGVAYNTATIKKAVLTPQKAGDLLIDPMEVKCSIRIKTQQKSRDPFANFFNSYNVKEELIASKPISIKVKKLPTPKPKGFFGAVGDFTINSSIDNRSIKTNDASTYRVKIIGTGNIDLIKAFDINFPSDFEVYDPKIDDRIFQGGIKRSTKTFEYLIIPRITGNYDIPKYLFTYFNPKTKKYITKSTSVYPIKVLKGDDSEDNQVNNINQSVKQNIVDINYIKNKTELKSLNEKELDQNIYYFICLLIILIILLVLLAPQIIIKNYQKTRILKNNKADKIASKRLKNAQKCIKVDDFDGFFEETEKALWGYFADKFNVQSADLSKESISKYFKKLNIDNKLEENFIQLINDCEFARYAPSKNKNKQMGDTLNSAKEIIIMVESKLK